MPQQPWQRKLNATRQPRPPKLVVLQNTPCFTCLHHRSSHSSLILSAKCKVPGCPCLIFEPICGCGHLLYLHETPSSPHKWSCQNCNCKHFGAVLEVPA